MNFESLSKEESPDSPESLGDNEHGMGVEPEFVPEKVDVVRLRSAIDIAMEGERPVSRHRREVAAAESAMSAEQLRDSIARREKAEDEEVVIRLEAELANTEKRESRDEEEVIESATEPQEEEKKPFREREGWVAMPTSDGSARLELPQFLKDRLRQKEIALRRSAMAREKDPIGLARVAAEEEIEELGKREADFMSAGPFEQISDADKLDSVREYKQFVRENPKATNEAREMHLKGILYKKLETEEAEMHGQGGEVLNVVENADIESNQQKQQEDSHETAIEAMLESKPGSEEVLEEEGIEYNIPLEHLPVEALKEGDVINVATQSGSRYSFRFFYMDTVKSGFGVEHQSPCIECISGEKLKGGIGKVLSGIEKGKPLVFGTLNTSPLNEIVVSQKPFGATKNVSQSEVEEGIDERLKAEQERFTREEAFRQQLGKGRAEEFDEEGQEAA